MKIKGFRKANIHVLVFLLVFASLFVPHTTAYAASGSTTLLNKVSTATANSPIRYNFSLSKKSDIVFTMKTNERIGSTISVKDPTHDTPIQTVYLSTVSENMQYIKELGIYKNSAKINLDAGNYVLELQFENDTNFDFTMEQVSSGARLNASKLTITKGFTSQVKVVNGGTMKNCTSSNKSVATVTNKGKITAKKNGTATIKVKLTSSKTLSCKVTVVGNSFKAAKADIQDIPYNTAEMRAYSAAFDKKGNIVVKFMTVNNNYGTISGISNFKVKMKNSKKTTTAVYKKASFAASVPSYKAVAYTVTIPKSCLKTSKDKIDLRTSKFVISGKF